MSKTCVFIQLTGGNDGLNTVIPLKIYGQYKDLRGGLAIPESRVLKLTEEFGLHPSLTGFHRMFKDGRLGIIQNVGMPNPNFSHFKAEDVWHTGSNTDETWQSGFVGRMNELSFPAKAQPSVIKIGTVPSLAMLGEKVTHGTTVVSDTSFYDFIDGTEPIPIGFGGVRLSQVREVRRSTETFSAEIKKAALTVTKQLQYPDTPLAAQLKIVARLIAGGLTTKVYIVSMSGFDTHAGQLNIIDPTTGVHAKLLQELGDAVDTFNKDLDFLGVADNVVGMTYSEFGRTVRPNGSTGTDHGHAAPVFYFGKGINSNKIFGGVPDLSVNQIPHEYDFRSVYTAMIDYLESNAELVLRRKFEPVPFIGSLPDTGDIVIDVPTLIQPGRYRLTRY